MTSFLREISALKRLVRIRTVSRILLVSVVIFLIIHALTLGFDKMGVSVFHVGFPGYGLFALLSVITAVFLSLYRRKSFNDVLIDIDERLKLKEKISTAYEYFSLEKKSEFNELLYEDAEKSLRAIDRGKIFPFRFSLLHLAILFLIVINTLFLLVDYLPAFPHQDQEQVDPGTREQIGELIKQYQSKRQGIRKEGERKNNEIGRKLGDIAKELKKRQVSRQRMDSSLREILREVQGEKTTLSNGLASKIDEENVEGISVIKKREIQKLALYRLKKLEEMMNRMFNEGIPGAIGNDLALLKEYSDLEDLLKQALHYTQEGSGETDDSLPLQQDRDEKSQDEMDLQAPGSVSHQEEREGRSGKYPKEERGRETGPEGSGHREGVEGKRAERDDADIPEKGQSLEAGKGKSEDRYASPYKIEKTQGPALQDKMFSSSGDGRILRIRSFTGTGEAQAKEEDIIRSYRKEIEEVMHKEDIPLNYREYIKNYFLLIHLVKEEDYH